MDLLKKTVLKFCPCLHFVVLLFFVLLLSPATLTAQESLEGWLTALWGDDKSGNSTGPFFHITNDTGEKRGLIIDEQARRAAGDVFSLNGKYVRAQGRSSQARGAADQPSPFLVDAIAPVVEAGERLPSGDAAAVSGPRPWISIMCKFSDQAAEPKDLNYFKNMYASTEPGFDHYWRELSYNTANVSGSDAAGWFTLPEPEIYYNPTETQGGADLDKLFEDCTAAADAAVDFSAYDGINMMFNTNFDKGYAWGGSQWATLDDTTKRWSVTWEPPWGYEDIGVIAHEMGHGFGLPHSSGNYGKTYDNEWDVMSDIWSNRSNSTDSTYGCLGQHTISYHKDMLGWIQAEKLYTVAADTSTTLTLEQLALPETANSLMVKIPINGSTSNFYTVEVRRKTGYDVKLPGEGVIIHEVDTGRDRPAHVVDDDGDGDTGDEGAIWTVGEMFSDSANKVFVSVLSATASGYEVWVRAGDEKGDVDVNGSVELTDVILLLQVAAGATPAKTIDAGGDATSDNYLGVGDAIYILQQLASP